MTWVLIVVGFVVLLLMTHLGQKAERERRDALMRRIGWGYGYGAGYVDGQRGVEYDLTAPRDGYARAN